MSQTLKKALIITYYFPPSGGAGVQRTLKFVKYLHEFGWQPVVLTARNADYPAIDESLVDEIPPDVPVYRSKILEPYKLYRLITGRASNAATDIATLSLDESSGGKPGERLAGIIRASLFVPDARIGWYFWAHRLGRQIIEREKVDVLFSSAPPYTTHLIGKALRRYSQLPWVADFRDSWIGWVSAPQWRPGPSRRLEQRMESAVLKEADLILTVSQGVRQDLESRNPGLPPERWRLLPNGFDAADFAGVEPCHRSPKLTITYTGSLYGARNPDGLVCALEKLQARHGDLSANLLVRLVGRVGDPIMRRIRDSRVASVFEFVPYVTHKESLSYLLASDVLLLIIDNTPASKGILTGKLFEYIGAGKPLLALAPEGEASVLIRENGLGLVAEPSDMDLISKHVSEMMRTMTPGVSANPERMALRQRFERRNQAQELAKIFDLTISKMQKPR